MCLSSFSIPIRKGYKVGEVVGSRFIAFQDNENQLKGIPVNSWEVFKTQHLVPSDNCDGTEYFPGFHVFPSIDDARVYLAHRRSFGNVWQLYECEYYGILATGHQKSMDYYNCISCMLKCDVASVIRINPNPLT